MTNFIKSRLNIIKEKIQLSLQTCQAAIKDFQENNPGSTTLMIEGSKLNVLNERFSADISSYYATAPDVADEELKEHTELLLQADMLIAEINVYLNMTQPKETQPAPRVDNVETSRKLPQIALPKFDGDLLKWHTFWDQFASNVDSRNMSEVDKLLYLQTALEGEAKQAVEGLETTNQNYTIAIDTLKTRYGNKSTIIDAHYRALYNIKTADQSVKSYRSVLNEIERHLRVLQSLGEDVNHNHFRVMIMEKFPPEVIYELRMKLTTEGDTISNIRKGLEQIISARESSSRIHAESSRNSEPTTSKANNDQFSLEALHTRRQYKKANQRKFGESISSETMDHRNSRKRPWQSEISNRRERYDTKENNDYRFRNRRSQPSSKKAKRSTKKATKRYCLKEGHRATQCKDKRNCYHCKKYGEHNKALCPTLEPPLDQSSTQTTTNSSNNKDDETILQTAVVTIYESAKKRTALLCRVLLDCGSQRSYITADCARFLNLQTVEENQLTVFTFGQNRPNEINSPVVQLHMVTRCNISSMIYANVVPYITKGVKSPHQLSANLNKYRSVTDSMLMADDGSKGDKIDILIGNDYYSHFLLNETKEVSLGLYLINSKFGWIWSGKPTTFRHTVVELSALTYFQTSENCPSAFPQPDLPLRNTDINNLWDLESIGITDSPKSTRDDEAIHQFNNNIKYIEQRYHVTWPWIEYPPELSTNFGLSYGRLTNLMKRLCTKTLQTFFVFKCGYFGVITCIGGQSPQRTSEDLNLVTASPERPLADHRLLAAAILYQGEENDPSRSFCFDGSTACSPKRALLQ
ncbi:unnamed protein product [Ceutorhynchus assimilis]|uniref:DUF1758 domain-containing protein n=1 Tax=Ceutorhynchus assimilis TaxID=467358 RepID=A0A9N9QM27_9CUCU|nr:unnamed protein product [Ceutorhynchus assimilis]